MTEKLTGTIQAPNLHTRRLFLRRETACVTVLTKRPANVNHQQKITLSITYRNRNITPGRSGNAKIW